MLIKPLREMINFARKGDPNHEGLPKWPAFSKDGKPTMVFDTRCEVKTNFDDARVAAASDNAGA